MTDESIYFKKEKYVVLKKTKIIIHEFWVILTKVVAQA
jgi:hypothetical protein